MPHFEDELVVPRPLPEVFDFFLDAHNLTRVSPPELHLRVVQAPPRLQLGSVVEARGRRWGVPQRIVSEVTALEPNVSFVDEQRHGPFGKFVHTHRFAAVPGGTRISDVIEYEPPGGVLGLVLTAERIANDLRWIYGYRRQRLQELLGG